MNRLLILFLILIPVAASAANLPPGFIERRIANDLTGATAMAFAPDGRLFVCQQSGKVRIIKDGVLLEEPFLSIETDNTGERGLLGIAFDPAFSQNGFVFIYYTALVSPRHNQVSRFVAEGDRSVPGSETSIFQLDPLSSATIHNGGAMHFGQDGKLYIAVGENGSSQNAQSLETVFGKMLRINNDGSIPDDNPFSGITVGNARAIWALGLRNPFTFDVDPQSGRIFINDVGENSWEEIDEGIIGSNFGWPLSEGATENDGEVSPLFSYPHGLGPESGCAITGGSFYRPATIQFPSSYAGKYFFADFCSGWVRAFDPVNRVAEPFADGLSLPVDLKVAPDGSLYYLSRGSDSVNQIIFTGSSLPFISTQPQAISVASGESAVFTVEVNGPQPILYQWKRNGVDIPGATTSSLTLSSVGDEDNGAQFTVVVSNEFGSVTSDVALLTVTSNHPPQVQITSPVEDSLYAAGETIEFSGSALDQEDGQLPASAFTWQVDFHHDTHSHPFVPATSGITNGSFVIPIIGEKSSNVWYRITLKVTDSGGRSSETFRDVLPRRSVVTVATIPAGLQVQVDGQPVITPVSFTGVVGIVRNISTAPLQNLDGKTYEFQGWSDGGELTHNIATPNSDQTITANFVPAAEPPSSSIQFSSPTYEAVEGDEFVDVRVMRTGDISAGATVSYATLDGTATEREDYLPRYGTLVFEPNQSEQNIRILLTNGVNVEDSESFSFTLFSAGGSAALGSPNVANVMIDDDDVTPPQTNPVDDDEFFVRQHYQDFLNREPDPGGLAFWINEITQCGNDPACRDLKRQNVSGAFFLSIEFQGTGFLVYRLNRAAFERFPTFQETLQDTQQLGRHVIVGVGDWENQLELNKQEYLNQFVNKPEFLATFPEELSPSDFVDHLDRHTGFSLSPDERSKLIAELESGELSRAQVLRSIIEDEDFKTRELNRAFVLFQYFGYLRRNPDDTPDLNFDGYDFWLNKLDQFNGNYVTAEMVRAFINSLEYRHRFGP